MTLFRELSPSHQDKPRHLQIQVRHETEQNEAFIQSY